MPGLRLYSLAVELTQSSSERVTTGGSIRHVRHRQKRGGCSDSSVRCNITPHCERPSGWRGTYRSPDCWDCSYRQRDRYQLRKIALSKSKNKEVRDFAQQMVTDHSALQKSVSDLGAKLNVTPADSDTSKSLKSQAEQTTEKLKALNGKAFDKAYIDNEVSYHQAVINATSSVLIPNTQKPELKSALQGAAPLFQG